ncbi:hypothetical protein BGAL_0167g00120 [Botrytis galanthina]|uniref:non-specific serine/threonine protein kinase n=1 Tax=Botrytis galanthina TaxID=278940 RepID=A0A4S8R731_9HELO|nr:hypothetical protein BGAL_0167g00120 [Botrytis galanthina]
MQAPHPKNKFDHTDKILEIIRGQDITDESVVQKIREIFVQIDTDVDAEETELIEEYEKAIKEEERAEAIAEAEMKAESAEAKERRAAREDRRLTHKDTEAAVEILRAIHQTTAPLRHNKWRKPNAGFTNENIRIIGKIGEGGFGAVYLIENIETKVQYAMKTQLMRENDDMPMMTPPAWRGAVTPPVTPSSEASKKSAKAMKERHLMTKRFNETKCYLQYIRSSHPSICNLEAFFDLEQPEDNGHCHIFEYCDWGNLENIVTQYYDRPRWGSGEPEGSVWTHKPENMPRIYKHAAIPEAFIWHVYMQTMEALSFLHGDHEFNKKQEFHSRNQVICLDIKLDNIFLKNSGKPNTYPIVKIGDFGEATYVPYGEQRWHDTGTTVCKAPEEPFLSAKYDVWCVGMSLYILSHSGRRPKRPDVDGKENIKEKPNWGLCDPHLSKVLANELEKPREMDVEKRWTAAQILDHIRPIAQETIRLTYRRLQNWARPELQVTFEEGIIERVEGGEALSEISESDNDDVDVDDDDDDDDSDDDDSDDDDGDGGGDDGGGDEIVTAPSGGEEVEIRPPHPSEQLARKQQAEQQKEGLRRQQEDELKRRQEEELRKEREEELERRREDELKRRREDELRKGEDELRKEREEELERRREDELKKRREDELKRREDELKRREDELKRREDELKRRREEGQVGESPSNAPPQKRRLIRYRKLRAYRDWPMVFGPVQLQR